MKSPTAQLIELAGKIDLGERPGSGLGGCPMPCDVSKPPRVWYPSLYISGTKQAIDLPDTGKAVVEYKITSRTTRERDGQKSHSADLEIQTIEPLDLKAKAKVKPGETVKLAALRPGMVQFARPRDEMGQFAGGESAGNPDDMVKAYGHPQQRPAALKIGAGVLGGAGLLGAGLLGRKLLGKRKVA